MWSLDQKGFFFTILPAIAPSILTRATFRAIGYARGALFFSELSKRVQLYWRAEILLDPFWSIGDFQSCPQFEDRASQENIGCLRVLYLRPF